MPSTVEILQSLSDIAHRFVAVAIGWHAVVAVAVLGIVFGWRPSRRTAALALTLPVVSVATVAILSASWFNAVVFVVLAAVLSEEGRRAGVQPIGFASGAARAVGALVMLFGLTYPHFVPVASPVAYLLAAPTGLLPCPTLALVIGATSVLGGLGSRIWSLTLAGAGLFYAAFGVLRLGVLLDLGLGIGAITLAWPWTRRRAVAASA